MPKTSTAATTVTLAFVGTPDQFIDGVPQADVEVTQDRAAELIATGLYASTTSAKSAPANEKAPTGAEGDPA